MRGALNSKLGAVNFVAALLRAGVVPAAAIHGCLGELLHPQVGGGGGGEGRR